MTKLASLTKFDDAILDYGCGQGRLCNELSQHGYTNVLGVDFSSGMIEEAKKRYPTLRFSTIDGTTLPYKNDSFQVALLFAVLTCVVSEEIQNNIVNELRRVIAPGGVLVVSDYPLQSDARNIARYESHQDQFPNYGTFKLSDGGVVRHHDRDHLLGLVANFEILDSEDFQASTMNGNPADILQIWARKG